MPLPTDTAEAGRQFLSILKPICTTMLLTLYFATSLAPKEHEDEEQEYFITPKRESEATSTAEKAESAAVNSFVYIALVTVATIVLVLLYKFQCDKAIFAWLMSASFVLLASLGGVFLEKFCVKYNLPLDYATYVFILYNFSVVGLAAIYWKAPLRVRQGYLILISAMMAWAFSLLPDWTAWALLVTLALYDLIAVLAPFGPLRMLVNAVQNSQSELPGLLYEATPTATTQGVAHSRGSTQPRTRVTPLPSYNEVNSRSRNFAPRRAPPIGTLLFLAMTATGVERAHRHKHLRDDPDDGLRSSGRSGRTQGGRRPKHQRRDAYSDSGSDDYSSEDGVSDYGGETVSVKNVSVCGVGVDHRRGVAGESGTMRGLEGRDDPARSRSSRNLPRRFQQAGASSSGSFRGSPAVPPDRSQVAGREDTRGSPKHSLKWRRADDELLVSLHDEEDALPGGSRRSVDVEAALLQGDFDDFDDFSKPSATTPTTPTTASTAAHGITIDPSSEPMVSFDSSTHQSSSMRFESDQNPSSPGAAPSQNHRSEHKGGSRRSRKNLPSVQVPPTQGNGDVGSMTHASDSRMRRHNFKGKGDAHGSGSRRSRSRNDLALHPSSTSHRKHHRSSHRTSRSNVDNAPAHTNTVTDPDTTVSPPPNQILPTSPVPVLPAYRGRGSAREVNSVENGSRSTHTRGRDPSRPGDNTDSEPPGREDPIPEFAASEGTLKLGLGDFVFYSVLIARAALYDVSTVATCFVGVLSGFVSTLFILAIFEKPLPALPISIALGLVMYILTKYLIRDFFYDLASAQVLV
eukprot:Rmarinus@m.21717